MDNFFFQKGKFSWQSGDPVSYQSWRTTTFGKQSADRRYCYLTPHNAAHNWLRCYESSVNHPLPRKAGTFHPHMFYSEACSAMLLINLADPQWISIPCDKILLGNIFCLIEDRSSSNQSLIRITPQLKSCSKEEVLKNGLCFRFIPEKMKSRNICAVDTRKIQFIFHTGNLIFPSLYTCDLKNIVTYTKYRDFLKTSVIPATFNNSKFALFVDSRSWQKLDVGGNIFKLRNNVYSSFMYIHINSDRESKKRSECPSLFYSTHSGKCKMFFDSLLNQKQYNLKVKRGDLELACSKGFNINKLLVNDLVIDCEDETDEDLLPLGSTPTCMQIGQISCRIDWS